MCGCAAAVLLLLVISVGISAIGQSCIGPYSQREREQKSSYLRVLP